MAEYYATSDKVTDLSASMAEYYGAGAAVEGAVPDPAMHPLIAERLGIDPNRVVSTAELANLLNGTSSTGDDIGKKLSKNAFIDFTFSAPKSLSVAIILAPTAAERARLDKAHRDAVQSIMKHIAGEIGSASIGDNTNSRHRSGRREPAHIAMMTVEHYTARPVYKMARGEITELMQLAKGDPQRHTHVLVPNVAVTDEGRVTSLYQEGLDQRIHEWGSLFQAHLATNLRKLGVNVELDSKPDLTFNERMARLTDVPRWVCDLYSKRSNDGEMVARQIATDAGLVFDDLSVEHKSALLGKAVNETRRAKDTSGGEYADWLRQAKDVNYQHRSVLRPGAEKGPMPVQERHKLAYETSLPLISEHFARRAVIEGSVPRIAAAKGLIVTGLDDAREVNVITAAHRTEGVLQDKTMTSVHWAFDTQKRYARVTTQLSVEMEQEAVDLLKAAAADKSVPLTAESIQRAVDKLATEGFDFTTAHGLKQRAMAEKTMEGARAMVWIGSAGVGKSTLLRIPVLAWHEAGRETLGVTLAWRQTTGLADAGVGRRKWAPDKDELVAAGIAEDKTFALDPFLRGVEKGRITPTANTTVIVDELGLVGTNQFLHLMRLQAKHRFQLVALGDDMQCQPIESGATFDLARRALGKENVPELTDSIRQDTQRDREIAALFRAGNAKEALALKDQDGTLLIVPGDYSDTVKATVDLWWSRVEANRNTARYTLGISVPTNADARAIGEAIRTRRQQAGEVGRDIVEIRATDQNGAEYQIKLAVGDRVRLFHRVRGVNDAGKASIVGNNGSVVTVVGANGDGIRVRPASGRERWVGWEALRKDGGLVRLAYGDAVTIDARQSDTLSEHITSTPAGSSAVNGFNIYTADSRHRKRGYIVTSQGAEQMELVRRRSLGDPANHETDPATVKAAVMENIARNLSRQPKKTLALDFIENSVGRRSGTVDAKLATWFRHKTRAAGAAPPQQHDAPKRLTHIKKLTGPTDRRTAKRAARKAHRERPRQTERRPPVPQQDPRAEFAEAIRQAGGRVPGLPEMDGKWHRMAVEGDRGKATSGRYKGYTDGLPAGFVENFKTGHAQPWRSDRPMPVVTADDRQRRDADRVARESERQAAENKAATKAAAIWSNAKPAVDHPYLDRKDVAAHGLRMTDAGNIVVPMRDAAGEIRNVQTITPEGEKRYLTGGRKNGLYAQIGIIDPDRPVLIAEGYATAATLHEATGLPVVVAFDASNLGQVARAIRSQYPTAPMVFAADNDHHLPRREVPLPNVGKEKAAAAAKEVGGVVLLPRFGSIERQPVMEKSPPTDWNDFAAIHGKDAVRRFVETELNKGKTMDDSKKKTETARPQVTQEMRDAARRTATIQQDQAQANNLRSAQRQAERQNSRSIER